MADGGEGVTRQVLPAPEPTRINQAASSTEGLEGAQLKKLRKICLAYQPYTLIAHVRSGQSCRLVEVSAGLRAGGEAEVRVPAEKAIVSLKVSTENKALHEALRSNQEVRTKLGGFLQKQGIPPERVQASRFSSTPKFGMFSEKAKSYRVDNVVKVAVQDEKELQIAATAVDSWPEVQFVGAEFEHEGKEALKSKAVAQACENAQKRSKIFEEKLGFKLVPSKFSGGTVSQRLPAMVGNYPNSSYARKAAAAVTPLPAAEADVAESVSSFGELIYTVEVTIEYQVQPK